MYKVNRPNVEQLKDVQTKPSWNSRWRPIQINPNQATVTVEGWPTYNPKQHIKEKREVINDI
jgi:hypothetical protein